MRTELTDFKLAFWVALAFTVLFGSLFFMKVSDKHTTDATINVLTTKVFTQHYNDSIIIKNLREELAPIKQVVTNQSEAYFVVSSVKEDKVKTADCGETFVEYSFFYDVELSFIPGWSDENPDIKPTATRNIKTSEKIHMRIDHQFKVGDCYTLIPKQP